MPDSSAAERSSPEAPFVTPLAMLHAEAARRWVNKPDKDPRPPRYIFECAVGWSDEDWVLVLDARRVRTDALLLLAADAIGDAGAHDSTSEQVGQ